MTRMLLPFQSGTASGSCGTVSWQIEHLDTRLIVMWSVPFNFNLHDSYFAVGMIFNRGKFTSSGYWFNQVSEATTQLLDLVMLFYACYEAECIFKTEGGIPNSCSILPNLRIPPVSFQMYYSEKGPYKRGSGGQTITFENSAVLAHGHMDASTYHPLLNISVIPQG